MDRDGRYDHIEDVLIRLHSGQWFGWSDSKNKVYENEAVLASLKNKLQDLDPESGAYKFTLRKISFYEKSLEALFEGPRDLASFVSRWVSSFDVADQIYAQEAIESVSEEMKKSYPHGHLNFKNGDIFLEITSYGFGNLFHQLAGVSDFATHSGLILKAEEGGYPYYFSIVIWSEANIACCYGFFYKCK